MQADEEHLRLLKGGDACDNGVQSPGSRTFSSSSHPSSPMSDISMMSGEVHRVMSSGDISVTEVTVPVHRHQGHSIAVKVRPAFSYYPTYHPVISGEHQRGLNYRRSANKARPFNPEADDTKFGINQEDDYNTVNGLDAAVPEAEDRDGEQGDSRRKVLFPTSKIGAFLPGLHQEEDTHRHGHNPKVMPFTRTTDESVIYAPNSSFLAEDSKVEQQQDFGASLSHERKDSAPSQRHVIYSPIPVSKVRPIFAAQPSSTRGHKSHALASKVRTVGEAPSATALQDKPFFPRKSGQSLHS